MDTLLAAEAGAVITELEYFKSFAAKRFRTQVEAAEVLGGPGGLDALLDFEEFAWALRVSGYRRPAEQLFKQIAKNDIVSVRELMKDIASAEVAATRVTAAEKVIAADLSRPQSLARATVQEQLTPAELSAGKYKGVAPCGPYQFDFNWELTLKEDGTCAGRIYCASACFFVEEFKGNGTWSTDPEGLHFEWSSVTASKCSDVGQTSGINTSRHGTVRDVSPYKHATWDQDARAITWSGVLLSKCS